MTEQGVGDRSRARLGIVLLSLGVSCFGLVDGLSKFLINDQSFGQIMLARYVLALPVLLLVAPPSDWKGMFRTAAPGLQIVRGLMPLIVGGLVVLAVKMMPLAEATVILFAGPFIVLALSGVMLGERVGVVSWVAVAIGFLAVLLVARPGFDGLSYAALLPAAAAFFYAMLQLMSRQLATAGERPVTTLAWTLATGVVISLPFAAIDWRPPSPSMWVYLVALGLCFGAAQYLLTKAFTLAPANVLTPFTYVQILAAVIFGVVVFGDVPGVATIIGIVMIVGAGVLVFRQDAQAARH